jgi:hypothetical protein
MTMDSELAPPTGLGAHTNSTLHGLMVCWTTEAGSAQVMEAAAEVLGITPYELGQLMGFTQRHHYLQYFKCEQRLSQCYMARIAWLLVMKAKGADMNRIQSIEWDKQEIIWRETVSLGQGRRNNPNIKRKNRGGGPQAPSAVASLPTAPSH